jgi:hypothetical protein
MTLTRPLAARAGFWLAGFVFLMTMAFSAVPGVATELLSARTAVSGFAAVLAVAVALVSRPLLRRSAHR